MVDVRNKSEYFQYTRPDSFNMSCTFSAKYVPRQIGFYNLAAPNDVLSAIAAIAHISIGIYVVADDL